MLKKWCRCICLTILIGLCGCSAQPSEAPSSAGPLPTQTPREHEDVHESLEPEAGSAEGLSRAQSLVPVTESEPKETNMSSHSAYTADTLITDVISDPVFEDYGRLIFPVQNGYWSGSTLGDLHLTWYSNIQPEETVKIANYLRERAQDAQPIFYNIYTEAEMRVDPAKRDTGLFFFRGDPGAKFAVCCAGGGFAYVAAMHDSFPVALELAEMGFNAFALIYRPGAQTACEDLAQAISFIFEHAQELQVDTQDYSVWGGSAGARMAAYMGTYGPAEFGGDALPRPGMVVTQYTGHTEYSPYDPPTYANVGTNDGIASWQIMQARLAAMENLGIPTEFHVYDGLRHGFGLGTGTAAAGWVAEAVDFWNATADYASQMIP